MVSDRQNGKTIFELISGRPGGSVEFERGRAGSVVAVEARGDFFEISERQRPARSSGRLGIHDFASEILPNPYGWLENPIDFIAILLNFLDFPINSVDLL